MNLWTFVESDIIEVKVITKASSQRIQIEPSQEGSPKVRLYVTCIPEKGKANQAVLTMLAKALGVPSSCLEIVKGHKSNIKRIKIDR